VQVVEKAKELIVRRSRRSHHIGHSDEHRHSGQTTTGVC
jgi:hypothetical protein